MKNEQHLNELFKFIKLIPENILQECIISINFSNRSERRKYERIKSLDNKIQILLSTICFRNELIEKLYNVYKDDIVSDLISYDEILSSINSTNYISKILYMLYRCCDDKFYNLYFSKFIQSEPFQKAIKDEWKSVQVSTTMAFDSDNTFKENNMTYYLGHIELRGTFYNFKPKYIYDADNRIVSEITDDDLEKDFPIFGSINLAYKLYETSQEFLQHLNVDKAEDSRDTKPYTSIYAIKFNKDELVDTGNDKILKKLDLQNLSDNKEDLSDRVISISNFNMFKIVTPKEDITNESFSGMIFIKEKDYLANEDVLLEYGDKQLVGPFKLQERAIDGEKYVRPDIAIRKYFLECYGEDDYEIIQFEKRHYIQNSIYTDIAYIKGNSHYIDAISDAILLTKLTESIDRNKLIENPEEFDRLYSTSPFLRDIPDKIRNERIERVQSILKNTSEYDDIKKKALNTLIESLDDNFLANKIQDSIQYKNLQKEIAELQNTSNELYNKNKVLENDNQILKHKLEENEQADTVLIDGGKIDELKAENSELKERLSVVENFDRLSDEFNKLKDECDFQLKLYASMENKVDKKKDELKDIENKIQEFISNAFKKADTTEMLRTAFDPYISNAMIEAAGSYRIDAEADQYKTIAKEFREFICSKKEKNELIDKLVNEVQKYRKYTKNEILNMFICFSQNFLTIFSGEPGTGKTSICNILANSLGLNNFGESNDIYKNRYVPVSVERGWSSKRDLIGYFNPLTKKYDRSNVKIYDGLMILNEEREESRFPYLILLDEANLSPIEYYWADFMRAADSSESDVFINIGLDKDIYIPKTLHFLATINNDQTTERLSPRLIDRAWIVKLPKTSIMETDISIDNCVKDVVLWSDIENAFVFSETKEMSLKTLAEQIYKLFDEHHLTVSPRVQQSIKKYVCVAQEIMEDEIGICSKKEKALDFAIVQKLLPKINGYYKDYERLFKSLAQICDENHLKMTKEALIDMEDFQRQNMGYCQYLV
ncbi:hypothetical protein B5F08_11740 [Anaeromassilibacillus sp. An172]|uniref:ATP-binding protein n=1 Tax=Anaeromassilibacillus sp. An172 TaxID=1965570 RepID=UPI000B39797E|nr:ATP-binding protein [Anaeromassilibacillus sp. An172]OUP74840.1 hypothetical protein B5F08_11740 [Anaeromassilibacillus sp. An172]